MRFLIVQQRHPDGVPLYEGMDRLRLGGVADLPQALIDRGLGLEDLRPEEAEPAYRTFLGELIAAGHLGYELLALDHAQADGEAWEFLGYDVGETTEAAWSALAHRGQVLTAEEQVRWQGRLNAHGLFASQADATAFLAVYLASDDPDKGWTTEGWTEAPDWYAVIPIHRLLASGAPRGRPNAPH